MISWFKQLDALLRGDSTNPDLLRRGAFELALRRFISLSIILGSIYGFFMGWYSLTHPTGHSMQLLASTVKLPLLFLLTLLVTFPSLYVFSALTGCRLGFGAVLRLLVATITINLAIAASLGPILGFFTFSTASYPFMIILNVVLLGVSGAVALWFLLRTLKKISTPVIIEEPASPSPLEPPPPPTEPLTTPSLDPTAAPPTSPTHRPFRVPAHFIKQPSIPRIINIPDSHGIFYIWILIYGLVGSQMGWLLRPFIGNPNLPFEWFRPRHSNFFEAVLRQLDHLASNGF